MKKLWIGIVLAGLLVAALVAAVAAQGIGLGRLQPLLINITQSVPVEVEFVVQGTQPQTVTVPMTLDLNLQVSLSSALTPTISVGPVAPAHVRTQLQSDTWHEDALGLRYQISQAVDWLTITEWTVYIKDGRFLEIAGEMRNDGEKRFSGADVVLRLYDDVDKLLSVEDGSLAPGRFVDPGDSARFKLTMYVDPTKIEWYEVEILTPH